ncbi:MAG TPA: isoprenylcysteine carboxylmethyltransferase family protein [Candidimonas sp.]|nr:isoprenylcysteine carboxylmethyltransferase family protein [Candidimonas sp.]
MERLELAVPPPAVMLVTGAIMWLLAFFFPRFILPLPGNVTAAVIVAVLGLGISMTGVLTFRRSRTTVDPRKPANSSVLVTSGIYRVSRNPMYLGILLALVGWALFLGNALALICAFLFVPYISRYQIRPEERILQARFGAAFTSYTKRVRRWI